jgi:hypothetical protein
MSHRVPIAIKIIDKTLFEWSILNINHVNRHDYNYDVFIKEDALRGWTIYIKKGNDRKIAVCTVYKDYSVVVDHSYVSLFDEIITRFEVAKRVKKIDSIIIQEIDNNSNKQD